MNREKTWKERVKLAAEYLKLGQADQYLNHDDNDYPWEFVHEVKAGGSHRLDMDTSVWFKAEHPSGLTFSWSFEIERREANGKGYYMIDVDGCGSALAALSDAGKKLFKAYLKTCAKTVSKKGDEWEEYLRLQRETASALERLSQ